ncbi:MAG: autotransporter assembly complex protein TamA [Alphaproteobacteria bacterium]
MIKRFLKIILLTSLSLKIVWAKDPYTPYSNVPYKTVIFGLDHADIREAVFQNSILMTKSNQPPESVSILRKRAEQDLVNIQKVVASFGYYDADFDYFVDVRTNPVRVYIKIQLNTQYKIGAFKLKSDPPNNNLIDVLGEDIKKVGISLEEPALKTSVQKAVVNTINYLQKHGYPFAKLKEDRIVIDRSTKKMQVALLVSPGPLTRFGNTILEENGEVTGEFIKSHMRWKKGEVYSEQKVLDTIQSLNNTRLFNEVKITHDDRIDENGFMNIYLKLEAAGKNKISPEKDYVSGLGLELGGSWEKRNLNGTKHILKSTVRAGKHRQHLSLNLTTPDAGLLNLNLNTTLSGVKEDLKPYDKRGGALKVKADYPIDEHWHVYGGAEAEVYSLKTGNEPFDHHRLLSLPVGFIWDYTDNVMRPKKGGRFKFDFIPYAFLFEKFSAFAHLKIKPEFFVPLLNNHSLYMRGWADIGFAPGAGKNVIPKDKKFYGGGGTHEPIRGYAFQMAGPLSGKVPVGGRSFATFGGELYYDLNEDFSILSFMDWGTTYDRQFPDFRTKMLWGVGGGVRYHTKYGIFYLDVASPIERRSGNIDNPVEIYAGIKKST